MKKKLLVEFIPLTILIVALLLKILNVPHQTWIIFFDGLLVMIIYMFFSFWLFYDPEILVVYRIIIGLVYMFAVFVFLYFSFSLYGFLLFVGLGYTVLLVHCLNCLFKIKTKFYKQHFYRSLFFLCVLTLIYIHHYY